MLVSISEIQKGQRNIFVFHPFLNPSLNLPAVVVAAAAVAAEFAEAEALMEWE